MDMNIKSAAKRILVTLFLAVTLGGCATYSAPYSSGSYGAVPVSVGVGVFGSGYSYRDHGYRSNHRSYRSNHGFKGRSHGYRGGHGVRGRHGGRGGHRGRGGRGHRR